MKDFLGETLIDVKKTEFKRYTPADWALYFVAMYGQIDGAHHKQWVLDQVARILNGTKVNIKIARWKNHPSEYRVSLGRPSMQYKKWVHELRGMVDGEYQYDYDEGIAP